MADLKSVVVASVQGQALSLAEFLHICRRNGKLSPLIDQAVQEKVVQAVARQAAISVGTDELQQAADTFRRRAKLAKAAEMHRWLADNHMSVEDLEALLERDLLQQKLAAQVPQSDVDRNFAEHRREYDRARIAHILVAQEGAARELLSQIQEEGASFADLARRHSLHQESKSRGGNLGLVARTSLSPAVEAAVFNARKGDVVGPAKTEKGYHLIQVEEILLGRLDGTTATAIRRELFRRWLEDQVRRANVQVRLYEYL